MMYDIWTDYDGHRTARPATAPFVTDADAPYGFYKHEVRVDAANAREALAKARGLV